VTAAENAKQRAGEIGAAAVLSKPFEIDRLIALIRRYCVDVPRAVAK
jgi:hypothetical protein